MRVVVQRVLNASCVVEGKAVSEISKGYLLLVGFSKQDTEEVIYKMINKIIKLRVFEDEFGKMNLNINSIDGEILSISQFTLYANPYDGNRPSFVDALDPVNASKLYDLFNAELSKSLNKEVKTGIFGADMKLPIVCDGPVTITLDF